MKRKTSIGIWIAVVILLMVATVAFYLYDVIWVKTPYTKNLFRTILIIFLLSATLLRLMNGASRNSLEIYEKAYEKELGYAFQNKPFQRKKLLCACRLYNESNYGKALKYLFQLLGKAEFDRDLIPVLLFIALCYTDAGLPGEAIKVYYDLLKIDANHAQVHSNLGKLFVDEGNFETALKHYNKSIELKPNNYFAYANRANYYFRKNEYDNAIVDAKQALAFKNNGVEAAGLLTIIYALQGDEENKKKYYHIAITSGKNPADLNAAIQFYLSEQDTTPPIPHFSEIVEMMYDQSLPFSEDLQLVKAIYNQEKTKRFILLKGANGYFKYTYQELYVFDEEEWAYICKQENALPAWWKPMDHLCANSFFGTEDDALQALMQEGEYKQHFDKK